jgi:hypothetical protein
MTHRRCEFKPIAVGSARALTAGAATGDQPIAPHRLRTECRAGGPCAHGGYKKLNQQCLESLGSSLSQFWLRERIRIARERLLDDGATVTDVATELGFSSSQHFATVFRRFTGFTPNRYRLRFEVPLRPWPS